MAVRRNGIHNRSGSIDLYQPSRFDYHDSTSDLSTRIDSSPNILPELTKIVRELLPHETPLKEHVRDVKYRETGCECLNGTLYLTIFRLVFAPDNAIKNNNIIASENKYISEYDIPLTSIYKIDIAPVNSQSGFKSFLNENQIQTETRTFTIITRDFRNITFSKCLVTNLKLTDNVSELSVSKMETYINALRFHCRCQEKSQLYPYFIIQQPSKNNLTSRRSRGHSVSSSNADSTDFNISNDERIRGYMNFYDWYDELKDANETQWIVDKTKFDSRSFLKDEGPFVRLANVGETDDCADLIWHWTHTSETARSMQLNGMPMQHMLVTVPGIVEAAPAADPLRRNATDLSLVYASQNVNERSFQRYNLTKFPCNLKGLQTSYEKLIDLCAITAEDDDDKWLSKLNGCKWFKYISKALHGAASLARLLNYTNIAFAGSDIDNSCLMSSLMQIFLRPKCRTIKGFCELIVREWLIRGHPFRERFGQVLTDENGNSAQEAPVFLLFLDCIHQLINQNPFSFEFAEYFLIELYHDVCYCYQHTFVFNSVIERLHALRDCPKNILFLSSFDFSLYLSPSTYSLLKNHASVFAGQKMYYSSRQQSKQNSTARHPSNRTQYRLESPKPVNFVLDVSSKTNELLPGYGERFEYDIIQSPQEFNANLYVDWRIVNIMLWSKCYCRYDRDYMPTLREQQLASEITCLQKKIRNSHMKPPRHMTTNVLHSMNCANSWHPQILETHV
ncbi:unnamed protein product [Rotaria magnacalcarata]|uniref:Myotubularin phosphatase domain-containing protein n=1 Tax=Rotaria magnacalcarata TaxID=392030 RepID=A0A816P4Z4_9BILA|nr:unnamed protein product [Rotaria magnacalcarata]CAF2153870.1 unnamed protein product [Rotaria magnacalcarata]CAF3956563.1 unnamed protein product [Rotaria magnacalcarata]